MFLKYLLNKDTLVKKRQTDDFDAFINKKKAAYSTLLSWEFFNSPIFDDYQSKPILLKAKKEHKYFIMPFFLSVDLTKCQYNKNTN